MRWSFFITLQFVFVVIAGGIVYIHKDRVVVMKNPPASLAAWYKPENKRQVWLHNMFNLRREVQAVRFYSNNPSSDNKDSDHLEKWAARLSEHYLKIGEMVPEWDRKLDKNAMAYLLESADDRNSQEVFLALDELNKSCESCHIDFQSITATIYRAPDFSSIEISSSVPYKNHMDQLTQQINQIKIASEDGMQDLALSSLADLKKDIIVLGKTCSTCHKNDIRIYPNDTINESLVNLEQSLRAGTLKEQGSDLGTLAVLACAHCHGTHRIAYHTRKTFVDGPTWSELIEH